jgi:hypothetical protein
MYVCMYVCVCLYAGMYVCIGAYVFMYECMCVRVCVSMYVRKKYGSVSVNTLKMHVCVYVYACVCMYVCMRFCIGVCMRCSFQRLGVHADMCAC